MQKKATFLRRMGWAWVSLLLALFLSAACTRLPPDAGPAPMDRLSVVMDNNYPPYVFQNSQGEIQGILVDQWALWAERTGVEVEITARPWNEALTAMQRGEYDVIDTIFYTPERAQLFDFTAAHAQIDVPIFFQRNISGLATAADLKGFRVAVKSGDANAEYLAAQGLTDLVYYDSYDEIVQAAALNEEAIFVIDQPPGLYFLYKYGIQDQFNYSAPLYGGAFHRAVRKGDVVLLNLVSDGFERISPAEYRAIHERWFGITQPGDLGYWMRYVILAAGAALLSILGLLFFNRVLQKRVRQRTFQLQLLLDNTHDLISRHQADSRVLYVNPACQAMLGYQPDELIGTLAIDTVHPEDTGGVRKTISAAVRARQDSYRVEHRMRRKSGEFIWVETLGRLSYAANGDLQEIQCAVRDISERKQAEEAMRVNETRFRLVSELTTDYIFRLSVEPDGSLRIASVTDNFQATTGRTLAEAEHSASWDQIIHPDDYPVFVQTIQKALQGQSIELECRSFVRGHAERWVHVVARPQWDETQARVVAIVGAVKDISDRKWVEDALRKSEADIRTLNAELEQHVVERTAQLQATNKELEAFAYSVSHDLRAPLRAIDGFSRIVLDDHAQQLDAEAIDLLQRVRSESQRMGQLIDALLGLSRTSRAEMHLEWVNLSELARLVLQNLVQLQPERAVEWQVADGLFAQGDARLLRVALENLLGNAWKFSSRRSLARIEFGVQQQGGKTTYFVRDNGAGFDLAYAGKLFGAFQRFHSAGEFEGTGIGLATVQRIVHRHGGQIWVETAPDQGASFYFTLG